MATDHRCLLREQPGDERRRAVRYRRPRRAQHLGPALPGGGRGIRRGDQLRGPIQVGEQMKIKTPNGRTKIEIEGETARGADLSGKNLSGVDLGNADLRGTNLSGANLAGADFSNADLRGANLKDANLEGARFDEANLEGAQLTGADLYWASLWRANLAYADLQFASCRGANLTEANLRGVSLSHANLGPDNVGGSTVLNGADLTEALIVGTIFDGVEHDERTRFPVGFQIERKR